MKPRTAPGGQPTPPSTNKAMQGMLLNSYNTYFFSHTDSITQMTDTAPCPPPGPPGPACRFPHIANAEEGHQRRGRLGVEARSSVSHSSPRCQTRPLHASRPASHPARCSQGRTHVTAVRAPALGSPSSPVGGTSRRWVSRE